jgi:hypothetical protein
MLTDRTKSCASAFAVRHPAGERRVPGQCNSGFADGDGHTETVHTITRFVHSFEVSVRTGRAKQPRDANTLQTT